MIWLYYIYNINLSMGTNERGGVGEKYLMGCAITIHTVCYSILYSFCI